MSGHPSKFTATSTRGCIYSRAGVHTLDQFKSELEGRRRKLLEPLVEYEIRECPAGMAYEYPIKVGSVTKSRGGKLLFRDEPMGEPR